MKRLLQALSRQECARFDIDLYRILTAYRSELLIGLAEAGYRLPVLYREAVMRRIAEPELVKQREDFDWWTKCLPIGREQLTPETAKIPPPPLELDMSLRMELAQLVRSERSDEAVRFEGVTDLRAHTKSELQRLGFSFDKIGADPFEFYRPIGEDLHLFCSWRNGIRKTRASSIDIWAFLATPGVDPYAWLAPDAMNMELCGLIFGFGQYSGLTLEEEALCVSVHLKLVALVADKLKDALSPALKY